MTLVDYPRIIPPYLTTVETCICPQKNTDVIREQRVEGGRKHEKWGWRNIFVLIRMPRKVELVIWATAEPDDKCLTLQSRSGTPRCYMLQAVENLVDPRGGYRWCGKSKTPAGWYSASRRRNRTLQEPG